MNSPERPQGDAIQEDRKSEAGDTGAGPQRMVRTGYAKSARGHPGQRE